MRETLTVGGFESPRGNSLFVSEGISAAQIKQLVEYSRTDAEVIRYTSDSTRFQDFESFQRWFAKGRTVYTLTDLTEKLQGIIWFGLLTIPRENLFRSINPENYPFTFAIRVYQDIRGSGCAVGFMAIAFADFISTAEFQDCPGKGIWLETQTDNQAALGLYQRFGFRIASNPRSDERRVIMVLDVQKSE